MTKEELALLLGKLNKREKNLYHYSLIYKNTKWEHEGEKFKGTEIGIVKRLKNSKPTKPIYYIMSPEEEKSEVMVESLLMMLIEKAL